MATLSVPTHGVRLLHPNGRWSKVHLWNPRTSTDSRYTACGRPVATGEDYDAWIQMVALDAVDGADICAQCLGPLTVK